MRSSKLRWPIIGFCVLVVYRGCRSNPAKGSDEKWLSQADPQSVMIGKRLLMPDLRQKMVYIREFPEASVTLWDFIAEIDLQPSSILRITSPDRLRLAVWTQTEQEAAEKNSEKPVTVHVWNGFRKRLEKQIKVTESAQMRGKDLYWMQNQKLWHQSIKDDTAELVADLSQKIPSGAQTQVETIQKRYILVSADEAMSSVRKYYYVDRSDHQVQSFIPDLGYGDDSVFPVSFVGADDAKLYFQISKPQKEVYFALDFQGKNAEPIAEYQKNSEISSNAVLSEDGLIIVQANQEVGIQDSAQGCQIIRQNDKDRKNLASIQCAESMTLSVVSGWLKIRCVSAENFTQIYFVHPQTGKTFEILRGNPDENPF